VKIIHTGDWHIGKIVNQVYMTEDQAHILEGLMELCKTERPDALIIAGDLYDRAVPPVEAVELLDRFFSTVLLELNIPILAIAGNHDSPDRVGFASDIVKARGLHIEGRVRKDIRKVMIADEHGPVNFYLIPYTPPAVVRDLFQAEDITDHDSAMKVILDKIRMEMNPDERNIIVTHGFVCGGEDPETSESEKPLSIGGTDYVKADYFRGFTYTALGHLHSPQRVGDNRVRYAGSLLKYSFSEVKQKKSVTVVHVDGGGGIKVELAEIPPRRDMRKIKGTMNGLLDPAVYQGTNVEDYLHITLTDEGEILDPMNKLRSVYPNVLGLDFEAKNRKNADVRTSAGEGYKTKSKLELFQNFYTNITGREFTADRQAVVAKVIAGVEQEERGE
jgi:exonuclease SbcD